MTNFKLFFVLIFLFFFPLVFAETKPWDFLRPLTSFAEQSVFFVKPLVLLFSLFLFFISFVAYKKSKSQKLFFVTIAFAVFAVKWIIKVLDLFLSPGYFFSNASESIAELFIFLFLFLALFYKER